MWLNIEKTSDAAKKQYRQSIRRACPKHLVIDGLFNQKKLDQVIHVLQQSNNWQTQQHTYAALYVNNQEWQQSNQKERFVKRDVWLRQGNSAFSYNDKIAQQFLTYLRSEIFMSLLSDIFSVNLTDLNLANPAINTNYFRLGPNDFVSEHADDSPGREVCMLLYLNQNWQDTSGGELVFSGANNQPILIPPLHNRCVLFDPSSEGSEHWVNKLNTEHSSLYRYNITSWYWRE
jgi:Rps23 Pro-64 3,4-dihydroxylase Tpa1-like proline 4-hydroxylase